MAKIPEGCPDTIRVPCTLKTKFGDITVVVPAYLDELIYEDGYLDQEIFEMNAYEIVWDKVQQAVNAGKIIVPDLRALMNEAIAASQGVSQD